MNQRGAYKLMAESAADYIAGGGSVCALAGDDRTKILELADALKVLGFQDEADRVREYGISLEG